MVKHTVHHTPRKLSDLEKVLETAFGGSASKLVLQALGRSKTSEAELKEIKKFIEQMEKERNESE